jgi:hypothetical protein
MTSSVIAFYTLTETLPLRVHLPSAHRRRFRGARVLVAARVGVVEWSTTPQELRHSSLGVWCSIFWPGVSRLTRIVQRLDTCGGICAQSTSAVTRAVGSALNPPLLFQEKGTGDELRGKLPSAHSRRFRGARVLVAARVGVVEWSTTPQRGRPSFRSTHTQYNNAVGTRLRRVRSLPDRSPAQHALRGTPVPPSSPTLGRHGPRHDAN